MIATSAAMGFCFGFALEKGQVYIPSVIQNQFLFQDNTMLKMFLSAAATSSAVLSTLRLFEATRGKADRVADEYRVHPRGTVALVAGGLILGLGMQLAGSCPGTVWIQSGASAPGSTMVWLGGLSAALCFSFLFEPLQRSGFFLWGESVVRKFPAVSKHPLAGYVFSAMLFSVVLAVDFLSPYQGSSLLGISSSSSSIWRRLSWHPAIAGMVVGLLELPAATIIGELIGSSQTYVTVAGNAVSRLVGGKAVTSYMSKYLKGLHNYWQVIYCGAAIVGSYASYSLSHSGVSWTDFFAFSNPFAQHSTISALGSFAGGFCLVFGARTAAGCTSGHGISGMGSLATGSFIAVAAMFASAIGLGVTRHFMGI